MAGSAASTFNGLGPRVILRGAQPVGRLVGQKAGTTGPCPTRLRRSEKTATVMVWFQLVLDPCEPDRSQEKRKMSLLSQGRALRAFSELGRQLPLAANGVQKQEIASPTWLLERCAWPASLPQLPAQSFLPVSPAES